MCLCMCPEGMICLFPARVPSRDRKIALHCAYRVGATTLLSGTQKEKGADGRMGNNDCLGTSNRISSDDEERDGRLIRTPAPLLIALGIAFLSMWPDTIGHASGLATSADLVAGVSNARVFFLFGLTANALFSSIFPRWNKRTNNTVVMVMACLSFIVTWCFSFPESVPFFHSDIVCMFCLTCIGFGYGWVIIRLLSQLAQEACFSTVIIASAAGLLLKTLLVSLLSNYLPPIVQTAIGIVSPLVALLMVYLSQRVLDDNDRTIDLAELPKLQHAERRVMFIALLAVAPLRAMVRILSNMGFWGSEYLAHNIVSGMDFVAVVCLIAIFSWLTLIREQNGDIITRLLAPFLVILGCFFFLDPSVSQLLDLEKGADYILNVFVELFSCILHWAIIVLAIRQLEIHPYRVAGISYIVYGISSVVFALILQNTSGIDNTLIILGMFFFLFALLLIFRAETPIGLRSTNMPRPQIASGMLGTKIPTRSVDEIEHVEELAEGAGLTPRETEIFILLAQGRSRTYIQNELFLAEGTVKTHTSRIYRKLGINSKQDLITLVRGDES